MELLDLEYGLKSVATAGNVLNCQEFSAIQAGLSLLKAKEKRREIFFWGKILGESKDYYIAYSLRDEDYEFPSKQFYYAEEDTFEFQPISRLTEAAADEILGLNLDGAFTGIPSTPLVTASNDAENDPPNNVEGENGDAAAKTTRLTELDRLAQVVLEIDFDTAVVPKGAHALNESHTVVASSDFKGVGAIEAASLDSYVHFRPPTSVAALRALARTDSQFYSNFLDPLESDLPRGCWAVRQDPAVGLVTLRSLSWPGYVAFHVPGTTKFGGVYFGYGRKTGDLPFIL